MFDICFFSGLPYTCDLCPEDEAPCNYMLSKKRQAAGQLPSLCDNKQNVSSAAYKVRSTLNGDNNGL